MNEWILRVDGNHEKRFVEPDGEFGSNTLEAVRSYQVSNFLPSDGRVGESTWSALLGLEMFNCFDLPKPFVNAPNEHQCWAGATAMVLKQERANTKRPPGVQFNTLHSGQTGSIENSHENMQRFALAHNLQMLKADALTCLQLVNLLDQFGRLMLNIRGINPNMQPGRADDGHFVNLVGARGNGQPNGTAITIYNPTGGYSGGRVVTASYHQLKARFPKLSYQVFYTFGNISKPIA